MPPLRPILTCLFAAAVLAGPASAQTAPARAEVPIRPVLLSDGAPRYAVPIKVGATEIEAGLDTGSTGLRVLPNVLQPADAAASARSETYSYGSGVRYDGVLGSAQVAVGPLSGRADIELIRSVGCRADHRDCAATKVSAADYRIQGDGLRGEGFKAILGINMARAPAENPLAAAGARRWIVELPRPGEAGPGRLVLNPTDAETEGFVMLPVLRKYDSVAGGLHDAVSGCLINPDTKQRACGALLMDCGAPGITVVNGGLGREPWPPGTRALLAFADGEGRVKVGEALVIGQRAHGSHLRFEDRPNVRDVQILSGLAAYFAFDVLYDPEHQMIGLKARPPAPGGPQVVSPAGA